MVRRVALLALLGSVVLVEVVCCFVLSSCIRRANRLAVIAAAGQGHGGEDAKDDDEASRYVRAYAPLSLRFESAARTSPRDGSLTLVFPASPGAPELALVDDVRSGRSARLMVAGVLVDVVPGSTPSVDLKSGEVAIRVSHACSGETDVMPVPVACGAPALASRALSHESSFGGGSLVRALVLSLPQSVF